jgi:SHAQKYF class myb-like DNA-binding protein
MEINLQIFKNKLKMKIVQLLNQYSSSGEFQLNSGTWSKEEHENFLKGHQIFGRKWNLISKYFVLTRSRIQVSSHAQKYLEAKPSKIKRLKFHNCYPIQNK